MDGRQGSRPSTSATVMPGRGRKPRGQRSRLGLLESLGYAAETADDGIAAMDVLARSRFDAVLMDVQMPRMDGYAATREIRITRATATGSLSSR